MPTQGGADGSRLAVRRHPLQGDLPQGRVRTAAEVRAQTGLAEDVAIVLLLHGDDELLESFQTAHLTTQIAAARYALVTAPSFSLWEPQRRPDNLLSLRRSLLSYQDLQASGVTACPRVGWVEPRDGERLAAWVTHHRLRLVSLDLMTYDGPSFDRAVAGLACFDELTGQQLHYLVDGVRARAKIEALYLAAAPDRVAISSATMAMPASEIESGRPDSFRARAMCITQRCVAAARAVEEAHASSVEEFLSSTLGESPSDSNRQPAASMRCNSNRVDAGPIRVTDLAHRGTRKSEERPSTQTARRDFGRASC